MEITSKNFSEALPLVKSAIEKCDFISIDGEFTGLYTPDGDKLNDLDTANQRYMKCRHNVSKLGIIQYGITTFRFDQEKRNYKTATFCFYLQGKHGDNYSYDPSSMNFLAEHDFDFNKLFKDGLPFISLLDESNLIKDIQKAESMEAAPSPVKVKDENSKTFLTNALKEVSKLVEGECEEKFVTFPGSKMNGFQRMLLYNNVAPQFPNILVESVPGFKRDIIITKFENELELEEYKRERNNKKVKDKVGFTDVIRHILQHEKPIIGHNLILDLLHTFHKFIQPLPTCLTDFQDSFGTVFPTVYDTKLIGKDPPFCVDIQNTALGSLYEGLLTHYFPPEVEAEPGCKSYNVGSSDENSHDAGYDSFITGICFSTMVKTLDGDKWWKHSCTNSPKLKPYENKLNMMNSYDIPYINLNGPDVETNRSHIFEVKCPSDWGAKNVRMLFSKYKQMKITWINQNLLYVIPQETDDIENAKASLEEIQASCPPNVHVRMYDETKHESLTNRNGRDKANRVEATSLSAKKRKKDKKRKNESSNGNSDVEFLEECSPSSNPRDLKRLKSVGSEKLGELTLESPIEEASKLIKDIQPKETENKSSSDFVEPEEW